MRKNNRPITIEDLVIYAEDDLYNQYSSYKFNEIYFDFIKKLEEVQKNAQYNEDLVEGNNNFIDIVCIGQHEYFKAGFCTGVRLLAESLGMNI